MTTPSYRESARDVPIGGEGDVVVCGAGPAGVAAALASARAGARTHLLETQGCLGGTWTAGLLSWIIDPGNKGGIMREITEELQRRGSYATRGRSDYAYDPEVLKLALEDMCLSAGVEAQLHTRCCAAQADDQGRMEVVLTESKSGRQAWRAPVFIDATGDGDVAAQAGCGYDLGKEGTGEVQPMTLLCLVTGIHADEVPEFIGGGSREPKMRLLAEMQRAGITPSYGGPTLFRIRDELFAMSINHEYGVSALDAGQITAATFRARGEVNRLVDALRSLGGVWRNLRLVATGNQIGVREGRRIHGLYRVTVDDLLNGARHEDAICRVMMHIDVHSPDPTKRTSYEPENRIRTQPYDIPLRALIARDVDGLLMAGRCISGDFLAHASYRVGGDAVATGEAAGVLAAVAAGSGRPPREVPWPEVREVLRPELVTAAPVG